MQIFIMFLDSNANNRQYLLTVKESQHVVLRSDDLVNATEISVYETVTQKLEYRVSKFRASARGNIKGSTAFDVAKKDVSSRMRIIEESHANFVMLLRQVKVCPAQCQNLVQTCLDGLKVMKEAYNKTSEDEV